MTDIIAKENTFYSPICNRCLNHKDGLKCKAFDIIPDSILIGKNDHSKPLKNQKNDVVFEAKKNNIDSLFVTK